MQVNRYSFSQKVVSLVASHLIIFIWLGDRYMYKDTSTKMKRLSIAICALGMTVSVIVGLFYIGLSDGIHSATWNETLINGIFFIIGGAVISWLVSLLVYGCGQILGDYREMKQSEEQPRRRVLEPQQREFV